MHQTVMITKSSLIKYFPMVVLELLFLKLHKSFTFIPAAFPGLQLLYNIAICAAADHADFL